MASAPEPRLDFDVYFFDPEESLKTNRCAFINGEERWLDTDEPVIHDMALVPFAGIRAMQEKIDRCKEWK